MAQVSKDVEKVAKNLKRLSKDVAEVGKPLVAGIAAAVAVASQHNARMASEIERLKAVFATAATEIGMAFLPMVRGIADGMRAVVAVLQQMDPELKANIASWLAVAAKVTVAAIAFQRVTGFVAALAEASRHASKLVNGIFGGQFLITLGAVAAGVAGIVLLVGAMSSAWKENLLGVRQFVEQAKAAIAQFFQQVIAGWKAVLKFVGADSLLARLEGLGEKASEVAADVGKGAADALKHSWEAGLETLGISGMLAKVGEIRSEFSKMAAQPITLAERLEKGKDATLVDTLKTRHRDILNRIADDNVNEFISDFDKFRMTVRAGLEHAGRSMSEAFVAGSSRLSNLVRGIGEGAAAGGIAGAVAGATAALLVDSASFGSLLTITSGILKMLSDRLGALFSALEPILGVAAQLIDAVLVAVAPVLGTVGEALSTLSAPLQVLAHMLTGVAPVVAALINLFPGFMSLRVIVETLHPATRALFEVLKGTAWIVLQVSRAIGSAWNGILDAVSGVFRSLANIDVLGMKPLGFLHGWADSLSRGKVNVDALIASIRNLEGMTYESAAAMAQAAADQFKAHENLAVAANLAAEALLNIPKGFRIEAARFDAMDAIPHMAEGGIVTRPTVALIGEAGPEAVVPLGESAGGGAIHVHFHGINDPVELWRKLKEVVRREGFRSSGAFV